MRSDEFWMPAYASLKSVSLCCVLLELAGPVAHSQERPAPPTPHTEPVLPGTHVRPQPVSQRPDIVLRIDGPATVNQKKCPENSFNINYTVINNTTKPINGTVRAAFNGAWLTPTGSAKLKNLPPGRAVSGAFTACCPSSGSFKASLDYHDETSESNSKITGHSYNASDSINITCK